MTFHPIDVESWDRKPYFDYYMQNVRCTYSTTVNIEIAGLLQALKARGIKLYPALIFLITRVVNNHREFRTRLDKDGNLGYWESMSPNYTVFHKGNETFSCIWTEYDKSFSAFYGAYLKDIEAYGHLMGLAPKPNEPANTFSVSCNPWIHFTSFNLNVYDGARHLLPLFAVGRYSEQDHKVLVPLSMQVHHAVCDGYHVGRFVNEVQELAASFQGWL